MAVRSDDDAGVAEQTSSVVQSQAPPVPGRSMRAGMGCRAGWRSVAAGALSLMAAVSVAGLAFVRRAELGGWAAAFYAAAALAAGSGLLWWTYGPPAAGARLRRRWRARRRALAQEAREWEIARERAEEELREAAERLAAREQQLNNRLITFHEWMEFPQPLSVAETSEEADAVALAEKDRQLLRLLEEETQVFFEKINENAYMSEGQFQLDLLRDDALRLIRRVARLYQPDADQPLLETSISQIVRSASRVCLQLLIVMDRLPLNVKEYNLNSLYRYVRQAVKAYGVYKATEPYLPYLNTAYYLGRVALGANPVSMGTWWLLGQRGKKLAQDFTARLVQRQVLSLLRDVIRVIGFETAAVYGGDFRHRDANWIYGVELVELMRQVPMSPDGFSCALREVGALPLRSEYDRVFLYRCVAAGQSADPDRYMPMQVLTSEERQAVARRLESFLESFRVRGSESKLRQWTHEVESRLGVRLRMQPHAPLSVAEQRCSAVRSLASYLLDIKQREPRELSDFLSATQMGKQLPADTRHELLQRWQEEPPFFFEYPELELGSGLVETYLEDLVELAVRVPPHQADLDLVLANTAAHLRHDPDKMRRRIEAATRRRFEELCVSPRVLKTRLTPSALRAALDLVEPGERVAFLYGRVHIDHGTRQIDLPEDMQLWLMGVDQRIVLFGVIHDQPRLLWRGEQRIALERRDGWLGGECVLSGGEWTDEEWEGSRLVVSGPPLSRLDEYFRPLCECPAVVSRRLEGPNPSTT